MHIDYEEYTLDNGLKVILHEDHSDPIVAQAIAFHVGSAREKEGTTGFAHFFEHMLFQRSENLPRNAFFNWYIPVCENAENEPPAMPKLQNEHPGQETGR